MSEEWKSEIPLLKQVQGLMDQFLSTYQKYVDTEIDKVHKMVKLKETLSKDAKRK